MSEQIKIDRAADQASDPGLLDMFVNGVVRPSRSVLNALWVCRVSVVSIVAGGVILYSVPQAHDLFLDLHPLPPGVKVVNIALQKDWIVFYLAVLLAWMLPVQLGARIMLYGADHQPNMVPTRVDRWLAVQLPWMLALACLVCVAIGQREAAALLPEGGADDLVSRSMIQVRSLETTTWYMAAAWAAFWILLAPPFRWLAVRFGLLNFGLLRFLSTAVLGARANVQPANPFMAVGPAALGKRISTMAPDALQAAWSALWLFVIAIAAFGFLWISPENLSPALERAPLLPITVGGWVPYLTMFSFFGQRWRLPLVAGVIMVLTLLANFWQSHGVRVLGPATTAGLTKPAGSPQPMAKQMRIEHAISRWRIANGCDGQLRTPCNAVPIIVAAEGGASRSAFFTASVLGMLDDLSGTSADGRRGVPAFSQRIFAISAVSGSALGAAAFSALEVDYPGAEGLSNPLEKKGDELWFRSLRGMEGSDKRRDQLPLPRKDALQLILSGDFLTPATVGLGRDVWAAALVPQDRTIVLEKSWEKRYAWFRSELQHKPVPGSKAVAKVAQSGLDRSFSSLAPPDDGSAPTNWRPLMIFNGTSVSTGRRIITSTLHPLMPAATQSASRNPSDDQLQPVFGDAYDTYDLMCTDQDRARDWKAGGACGCAPRPTKSKPGPIGKLQSRMQQCDVSISTAISSSARFPVISSHGEIKGSDGKTTIDTVVDGGFFDYSGIVTAAELDAQIRRVDPALQPFLLAITNDPGFNPDACNAMNADGSRISSAALPQRDVITRAPSPPTALGRIPFSMLGYPIMTVFNGRVARSQQSQSALRLLEDAPAPVAPGSPASAAADSSHKFDILAIEPRCQGKGQVRPVPMNWWLSMQVQEFLDAQLCNDFNTETLKALLALALTDAKVPDQVAAQAAALALAKQRMDSACRPERGPVTRSISVNVEKSDEKLRRYAPQQSRGVVPRN